MNDIELFYADTQNKLTPFTSKQIEVFIEKMNKDNSAMKEQKKNQIKFLIYNGKEDIIEQIKESNPEFVEI